MLGDINAGFDGGDQRLLHTLSPRLSVSRNSRCERSMRYRSSR
jgi:hypothetical protein